MLGQDLFAHLRGHGRGRGHRGPVGPHDLSAERLLLVRDLDHVDLTVQAEISAGHGQGGPPLAGAGLGGDAFQSLLFGIIGLGDRGIELMGTGSIVAFKFIIDFGRCLQFLLQAVCPDQGRRTVHLIEIPDLFRDRDQGMFIIQLLLDQLFTEYACQLFGCHGLMSRGIQERGRLFDHIGPYIIPIPGHLIFCQVNLIGDLLFFCHFVFLHHFVFMSDRLFSSGSLFRKQKKSCPAACRDRTNHRSCGATRLDGHRPSSLACQHMPDVGHEVHTPSSLPFPVQVALRSPLHCLSHAVFPPSTALCGVPGSYSSSSSV